MRAHSPTIGLEIHAELNTRTKMFCDSLNDPHEKRPNQNVCPICLGHPGALPVANKDAIRHVIRVGLALGGEIAPRTKFDRKNYFYPDLPKGYQISQYDEPLVSGGNLLGIRIKRIHLEEDAGNLIHEGGQSLADYNRAGVPLMELVTEPDIASAEQAVAFAKELQRIFRYLGVSHANMEQGEMRVEVNISLDMGTKVEVKNLNSFRAVSGAILYETERQKKALETGEKIVQETRGWDDVKRITVSQRSKEEAQDYRYFPEPDLPPFTTDVFEIEKLRDELPELPQAKRERFMKEFKLSAEQAEALIDEKALADYFEEASSELAAREEDDHEGAEGISRGKSLLFNYLTTDLRGLINERGIGVNEIKITPGHFANLIDLIADGKITSRQAKNCLREMFETGSSAEAVLGLDRNQRLELADDFELSIAKDIKTELGDRLDDFNTDEGIEALVGKGNAMTEGRVRSDRLRAIFKGLFTHGKDEKLGDNQTSTFIMPSSKKPQPVRYLDKDKSDTVMHSPSQKVDHDNQALDN